MKNIISKALLLITALLITLFFLIIHDSNKITRSDMVMEARVIENNLESKYLTVSNKNDTHTPDKENKLTASCKDIKILDKSGEETTQDTIKHNDEITIVFDGIILENYPASISNVKQIRIRS